MNKPTLIDFIKDFKHVFHVDHAVSHAIVVSLTDDYVFADTGYHYKVFKDPQAALFGANIVELRKLVHTGLVNGKIPAKTVCPYRDRCIYAKANTCGHLGVGHTVEYSCGAARAYKLDRN